MAHHGRSRDRIIQLNLQLVHLILSPLRFESLQPIAWYRAQHRTRGNESRPALSQKIGWRREG